MAENEKDKIKTSLENNSIESYLFGLINDMENGIVVVNNVPGNYKIEFANKRFCKATGITQEKVNSEEVSLLDFIMPSDRGRLNGALKGLEKATSTKENYRLINDKGEQEWQLASHSISQHGGKDVIFITYTSIQEIMGVQHELKAANEKWENIINSIPVGISIFSIENGVTEVIAVNDFLVNFSNEVGRKLDGHHRNWSASELSAILNQNIYAFSEEEDVPKVSEMLKKAEKNGFSYCTFRLRGSVGNNTVWIRACTSYSKNENGTGIYYVTYANVTQEVCSIEALRESHEKLKVMSLYDPLTKVHSRNAYDELLEYSKKNKVSKVGFIFADVNGLKTMNDTFGHRFGDQMISTFADILRQEFDNDDIYRISGDEFVVIAPELDREAFSVKVARIFELAERENNIASVGCIWDESPRKLKDMIDKAEKLMYVEKQQYYASKAERESKHHKESVNNFIADLENGLFMLYLQPKSNIDDMNVVGAEALVRKKDIAGKLVYPDSFIPLLEKEMLIPLLDYFMLEETCKTLKRWEEEGKKPIKISVNMSRVTFAENNFLDKILSICDKYDVDRSYIEFEVTESAATLDNLQLKEDILRLKAAGFSVSLDDMGTDYSALRMLLVDGIDMVKLDRSFINQLMSERGKTLLKYMIVMAHELGINCIAEGVEDDDQREELKNLGCDMYQGYLLSRPVPVEEFEKLLK